MSALLAVQEVSAGYGPIDVLKNVSLEVGEGEMVALIGANGAGKSTLLLCISRCVRQTNGDIRFAGRITAGLRTHELAGLGMAHAPEGRRIFPRLTVAENLE